MAASGDCYCALHIAADRTFREAHQNMRQVWACAEAAVCRPDVGHRRPRTPCRAGDTLLNWIREGGGDGTVKRSSGMVLCSMHSNSPGLGCQAM